MPAERAGYTVTMFLIDTSPSMGAIRTVEVQTSTGQSHTVEMTNLEYGLQYVKLKIQQMIFDGRKTDQCGVIVFGSEDTKNIVNDENGEYRNVIEYIPIAQPNAGTIAKIDALAPSTVTGDPIDALIVGIETQNKYLNTKKTWTRKIALITDGENPIEVEDWEITVAKMNLLSIHLIVVGIDFDDDELPYTEPNKSNVKRVNEEFYQSLTSTMASAIMGNCQFVLEQLNEPEAKSVRSALMATTLRVGDPKHKAYSDEALEFSVKLTKATSMARPKSWKKFCLRADENDQDAMAVDEHEQESVYAALKMRTEYYVDRNAGDHDDEDDDTDIIVKEEDDDALLLDETQDKQPKKKERLEKVEKEDLIRGYKYGSTYAPCPDGSFPRLETTKGIDICGFFPQKHFRRELSMGEVTYVWGDPSSAQEQVALSSMIQAMQQKEVFAIARHVSRDGMDPKMGVLIPVMEKTVHYLLWGQMPFADDVRKYTFASLDTLINKKGEVLTEHPYLPTQVQIDAMDNFVDAMDLMRAGDKDDDGQRTPWFNTTYSFNPAIHRVKQAIFHCAVVNDITSHPLPPPHPSLTKYFDPPAKIVRKAQPAIEACKAAFNVKEVPKRTVRAKKDGHVHAHDDDDSLLLLDRKRPLGSSTSQMDIVEDTPSSSKGKQVPAEDSETEDEDEDLLLDQAKPSQPPMSSRGPLPTPARSVSPPVDPGRAPGRIIGSTHPLKDFQKSIAQGSVSKAVEDLTEVVTEIVNKPFASRRTQEMLECMFALRETCLMEDEIDAWNSFLVNMKKKCLSNPGNLEFWKTIQEHGRELSLISDQEAKRQGGDSLISENEAGEFIS